MMLGTEGSRIFDANPAAVQIDTMPYDSFNDAIQKQFQPLANEPTACFDFFR